VETALNPKYKDVPMAVCGSEEARHGIVLAKNELAKKYKINTAETVYSAKKKCPGLVIAEPHYEEYSRFSKKVNEIYSRYTDLIEPFGIDESWLDLTASQKYFGSGLAIAEEIRETVKKELGITVSIGVSFNKTFAKLGSDYKKPDAVTVISEENYKDIVFPLPVSDLLFVGRRTSEILLKMGIRTIGELASANTEILSLRLGKSGVMLHEYANGFDTSPVSPPQEDQKSISNGFTFKRDLVSDSEIKVAISFLSEEIGRRLRINGQCASTVSITIKDEFLQSIQRQRPQQPPTDISREIASTAYLLLKSSWQKDKPIRMITVSASNLIRQENASEQISFFDEDKTAKRKNIKIVENTVDKIRQRYGSDAIINASFIENDIGIMDKPRKKK
jgi:DNA polymerase-4